MPTRKEGPNNRPWLVQVPRGARPQVYAEGPGLLVRVIEVGDAGKFSISVRNHDTGKTTIIHWCDDHAAAVLYATNLASALQSWYMPVEVELFQ